MKEHATRREWHLIGAQSGSVVITGWALMLNERVTVREVLPGERSFTRSEMYRVLDNFISLCDDNHGPSERCKQEMLDSIFNDHLPEGSQVPE